MPLRFALKDNHLTPDPTDYMAWIPKYETMTDLDILRMILMSNAGLADSEVEAVLKEYIKVILYMLQNGNKIKTSLVTITPRVNGVFHSMEEPFTPGKHKVKLRVRAGAELLEVAKKIQVEKIRVSEPAPILSSFLDIESTTKDSVLTPGKPAKIMGDKLKFDNEDAEQGIFFVSDKNKVTRVSTVIECKPKSLILMVPAPLAAGTYQVQVRAKLKGSSELRTGVLKKALAVA